MPAQPTQILRNSSKATTQTENFIALPLDIAPIDVPLPAAIYVKILNKYIKFRSLGDVLEKQRVESLLAKKMDSIYLKNSDWISYVNFLENYSSSMKQDSSDATIVAQLRHMLVMYSNQLKMRLKIDRDTLEKTMGSVFRVADAIRNDVLLGGKLLRKYSDPALYRNNHDINVAVYSAAVATKLNLSVDNVRKLTLGAFLHNIGIGLVPNLPETDPLTDEQKKLLHTHTDIGGRVLRRVYPEMEEIALVAEQHHERFDGSGYPKGLKGDKIHLFARICKIADVFDALTSARPCSTTVLTSHGAVEYMRHLTGRFDPALFQTTESLDLSALRSIMDLGQKEALTFLNKKLEALVEARASKLKHVNEKLYELATVDPLTQLLNRRAYFQKFLAEIKRSNRYHHPIALIMIDVDYFKSFNDSHGHLSGDEALKKVASIFVSNLRQIDVLCRYGGEEFLIMLPETGLSVGYTICERLRTTVEKTIFQGSTGNASLTISIGLSGFPENGQTPEELLQSADRALYEAKQSGRNRTSVALPSPVNHLKTG